jgi:hypothetical protein
MEIKIKRCPQCGQIKGYSEFGNNVTAKDGRQSYCKGCWNHYQRQYYQAHLEYYERWRAEHKTEIAKYRKQWRTNLKHEVLAHYSALRGQKDWDGSDIITPCCGCCGENDLGKLCIDHIQGGGGEHRRILKKRSWNFYRWLKQQGYPKGYQTLCLDCNNDKKRWEREYRK